MTSGKFEDLSGRVFGRLTVIKRAKNVTNRVAWLCECECGSKTVVKGSSLKSGNTQSCGCFARERQRQPGKNLLPDNQGTTNVVWRKLRVRANRDDILFDLTVEKVAELCQLPCYYCGASPHERKHKGRIITFSGLDRINSDLGYTRFNVVPCCSKCNTKKGTKSFADFIRTLPNQVPVGYRSSLG